MDKCGFGIKPIVVWVPIFLTWMYTSHSKVMLKVVGTAILNMSGNPLSPIMPYILTVLLKIHAKYMWQCWHSTNLSIGSQILICIVGDVWCVYILYRKT